MRAAGLAVADRLLARQQRSGVIADEPGGAVVNEDSNLSYALWGLAGAHRASGEQRYLRGLRRGVRWLADRLVMAPPRWRGSYWYAYRATPPYPHLALSPGGDVADVRGVDATSALLAYDVWLYTRLSGDRKLARTLRARVLAAVDFVLHRNRAADGFFYSSWQRRRGAPDWRLWRYQYTADQADVWLGMTAAARLYGKARHRKVSRDLRRDVARSFYLPGPARFALGRAGGRDEVALEGFNGIFPQGYLAWVFPAGPQTRAALAWLAGCVEPSGAPRCRPGSPAYSLSAAVLALGERRAGGDAAGAALDWVLRTTFDPATGAVGDSDRDRRAAYSNVAGFTALALLDAPRRPFAW